MLDKLFKIFLILLFCNNLYAEDDQTTKFFVFDNFSGGLNSHVTPYKVDKTECQQAENIRFNKNYAGFGKRNIMRQKLDLGSKPIRSLHRYYNVAGDSATIGTHSTKITAATSDTISLDLKTGLNDNRKWTSVTWMDKYLSMDGADNPIKWDGLDDVQQDTDGNRTADNIAAELGAPFAELDSADGGNDLDASSWYMYKVAHFDDTNYYHSTARSNPILTGATVYNIALTDIPLGESGTITTRYIYRTLGNASKTNVLADTTYYLVDTIADNTTTTYADNETDDDIDDDNAPTWATASGGTDITPPVGKYCELHAERLWISGNSTYPSDVYYSDIRNPNYFASTDVFYIRPDDGDKVTFMKNQLGILTIGKTNTIQKIYTDTASESSWTLSDPFSFIGCSSPYSVANTPQGIMLHNRNGLYSFNGQNIKLVSDAVTDVIEDIDQIGLDEITGYYFNNEYHLAYRSSASGSDINDRVLVYDLIRDAYSIDRKNIDSFEAFDSGSDQGVLYLGSSDTDGIIWGDEVEIPTLLIRYKSELDAGTFNDTRTQGTETAPTIELAWDCTIDGWLVELQTKDALISTIDDIETYIAGAIIDRPDTDGTWISPVYTVNATTLDTLYWSEKLYDVGDMTWNIRTSTDDTVILFADWGSSFSDSTGSDVSSVSGDTYLQLRANLSTTNINTTPELYFLDGYVFQLYYTSVSSTKETDVTSIWKSGKTDFGAKGLRKAIERIRVFYRGTEGTITVYYKNDENTINNSFTIDLTIEPTDDPNDYYEGMMDKKIYIEDTTLQGAVGTVWEFRVEHTDVIDFDIDTIEIALTFEESNNL